MDFRTDRESAVTREVSAENLPAIWETQVRPPGGEDPLEKGIKPTPVFLPTEFHGQRN